MTAFLGAIVHREYSWSNSNQALKATIGGYEKDIESLKLHLLMNDVVECSHHMDNFSIEKFQEKLSSIVVSASKAINLEVVDLTMLIKPYILNWGGLLTIVLCTMAMFVEIYRSHSDTVFSSTKPKNKQASSSGEGNEDDIEPPKWSVPNKFFETYIAKRKIFSNLWMYFLLFLLGLTSWFNLLPMTSAVSFILKFSVLWMISSYISLFTFNFIRLIKYLPKGYDETKKCLLKLSWWIWLIPRILTNEGFIYSDRIKGDNGLSTAFFAFLLNFVKDLTFCYPYYYFYYYNHIFYNQQLNTEIQYIELIRRRNIFLLNMIIQISIAMIIYNIGIISAVGSPKYLKKIIKKILDMEKETAITFIFIICLGNNILCIMRVLWYSFTGGSTYYATYVLYLFLLPQISLLFSNISINFILSEKAVARTVVLESFLRVLIENHIMKNRDTYESMENENEQQEICNEMALLYVDLFEGLLDATGAYTHTHTYIPICLIHILFVSYTMRFFHFYFFIFISLFLNTYAD